MKPNVMKNEVLMSVFDRVVSVSGKANSRSYTVNARQDVTGAEDISFFCFLEYGFEKPAVEFDDYGAPAESPHQLLHVKVQNIWGTEITVTDIISGKIVMNCYYSPEKQWDCKKREYVHKAFIPRKTLNKPNHVLNTITFNAEFLSEEEAMELKDNWDDEEFWMYRNCDPFGCASDFI